jgi:Druantia protein DruA
MERSLKILKREIGPNELGQLKELIDNVGDRGRTHISKQLCRLWDWRLPNGQLRDIACRDLLRRLDKRGLIQLPAPLRSARRAGYKNKTTLPNDFEAIPLSQSLRDFSVIEIEMVRGSQRERFYNALIDRYHYLGYHQGSGEQLKYIIGGDGHVLAGIGFGGAAFKSAARDQHIGWDQGTREQHLVNIVNNNRFLILPWISVPHLASHILGRISRRIRADWQDYYNRDIVLLETFVEQGRFKGTCYKAANWRYIGQTTGRGRNDRSSKNRIPIKDIYLYPLDRDYQQILRGDR